MPKLVSQEGGRFPFDFDQQEGSADVPPVIIQGILVAPERKRRVEIPAGTPREPHLKQSRQSRITVALDGTDPKFSYRPAKSDHPDIGVRFGRENAACSLTGHSLDSRPTLSTARHRKTTIPLSGLPQLEPTHRLINLNVPFETVAIALSQLPSEFKLNILTTGGAGLSSPELRQHYRDLLAQRIATEAERMTTKTELSISKTPEIPW